MNVTRSFWLWMSFLEGRTQQVNLQGVLSFTASCPAGVPQRSAISPTLFNIHIADDMEESVSEQACVNTTKYADDCTMDTSIRTGEFSDLQSALDSVQSWAVENKMELNGKKLKICGLTSPKHRPSTTAYRRCYHRKSR